MKPNVYVLSYLFNDFNAASRTNIDSFRNILGARTLMYSSTLVYIDVST